MSIESIRHTLTDDVGVPSGSLVISSLPRRPLFIEIEGASGLREGAVYRYALEGIDGSVQIEPAELFEPDDASGRTGRVMPGQSVGRLAIQVRTSGGSALRTSIEVAPVKLQQQEYRQMLDDIAGHAAEAVLQGFAPTTVDLAPSAMTAELLYQRFALLEARIQSTEFTSAIALVTSQPHSGWETITELRPTGAGYPAGSAFGRALAAPGPRRQWLSYRNQLISTLPTHLSLDRHEVTLDTDPNRFIKYALQVWRSMANQLIEVLGKEGTTFKSGPVRRGLAAAQNVMTLLDEILGHRMFREVGHLDRIPTSSQVLLKRAGYRELFRTFALVYSSPSLMFDRVGVDDVYSASQRNVASLYEFWCYLVLAEAIGGLCGESRTGAAFALSDDQLSLVLVSGANSRLVWTVKRDGRLLEVELFYNRQFSAAREIGSGDGSWSRAMRPDCSLRVRPVSDLPSETVGRLDVWLHFDAKYRVDRIVEQLTPESSVDDEEARASEEEETESHRRSKREDLLKMHAYRDAISRTAGAYVLYPGDEPVQLARFNELLPGLGAFPLRPLGDGVLGGIVDLAKFLSDVLIHVSRQASQHERERFWNARIHSAQTSEPGHIGPVSFLDRPPADTEVLLGYVRSAEHRAWIDRTSSYNVRADSRRGALSLGAREFSADLLLLYELVHDEMKFVNLHRLRQWHAVDRIALLDSGYPQPGGAVYLVNAFERIVGAPEWLNRVDIGAIRPNGSLLGAPFAVSWSDLITCVA